MTPKIARRRLRALQFEISETTLCRWCRTRGFGVRVGGRWVVFESKLAELERALRASLDGGAR